MSFHFIVMGGIFLSMSFLWLDISDMYSKKELKIAPDWCSSVKSLSVNQYSQQDPWAF